MTEESEADAPGDAGPVGYGRPPRHSRFRKGQSGNPRGRPKGSRRQIPYDAILGQKVVIRENGVEKQYTAAEAFLLQLAKQGLEGKSASARHALAAIAEANARRGPPKDTPRTIIIMGFAEPGSVSGALERLRMGQKLDRFRDTAHLVLETWIIEAALARLGNRRLTKEEQKLVVAATRSPGKVRWPDWWVVRPRPAGS